MSTFSVTNGYYCTGRFRAKLISAFPELRGCAGNHSAKSLAFTLESEFGSRRNCSSVSSSSLLNAGRGRSSRISRSHSVSPANSGNNAGICRNNLSRSDEGNVRIASSISCAVLINARLQRATVSVRVCGDASKPQRNVSVLPVNLIDPSFARAIISDCEDYEMPEMQLLTLVDRIRRRSN